MNKFFLLLSVMLLCQFQLKSQVSCDDTQRYIDYVFEVGELESTETVFANFESSELWNDGDTTANNVCFDPRNYLDHKDDGTWNMSMTVISPSSSADACTERAVIVFLHGGGYAHKPGNNTSPTAIPAYVDLAQRGFVVCAINYRKGWDIRKALHSSGLGPLLPGCQTCQCENGNSNCDPFSFTKITYAMAQDTRAAHRKLLNNKSTYGIDENLVFYMGASTGAVGALHAAHGADDMPLYSDDNNLTLETHLGGIDAVGEKINNGSTFKIAGVSTIAGALKDGSWIENSDEIPVMFNHGTLDEAVLYCTGTILNMKYVLNLQNKIEHLRLEGPGRLYKDVLCLEDTGSKTKAWLRSHKGLYHNFCAPLGSADPSDNCDQLSSLKLVQDLNAEFMKEVILGNQIKNNHKLTEAAHVSGPCNIKDSDQYTPCENYEPCVISSVENPTQLNLKLYPVPAYAGDVINVESPSVIKQIQLIDIDGKVVLKGNSSSIQLNAGLSSGVYFLRVDYGNSSDIKRLIVY